MVSYTPAALSTEEGTPDIHCGGGCVGPRTGLDALVPGAYNSQLIPQSFRSQIFAIPPELSRFLCVSSLGFNFILSRVRSATIDGVLN
jgi:hypothetical protein